MFGVFKVQGVCILIMEGLQGLRFQVRLFNFLHSSIEGLDFFDEEGGGGGGMYETD